jgi:hypothetical protein
MKPSPLLAIVRGERIDNVTPKGGRSYAQVRGLLQYVAYGHYADHPALAFRGRLEHAEGAGPGRELQQRGVWLDQGGRLHTHAAVQGWAKEKVHRFEYDHTYQLLLSTRDGGLSAAEFNQALQQGGDLSQVQEWRLMVHDDSDHQHAHAILFSHEKLSPARYKEWQQTMQDELAHLQIERQTALAQQTALTRQGALEIEQPAERVYEQARSEGWELAYD